MPEPFAHPDAAVRALLASLRPVTDLIGEIVAHYEGALPDRTRLGLFLSADQLLAIRDAVAAVRGDA